MTRAQTPAGWEDILEPGERILWQGRPDAPISRALMQLDVAGFGLAFAGFAALWIFLTLEAGPLFWGFGLLHLSIGIGLMVWALAGEIYRLRRTWYTLTDRRAIVATHLAWKGRTMTSYPIPEGDALRIIGDPPATLQFAERRQNTQSGTHRAPIGFERIFDAGEVLRLMRQAHRGPA